MKKDAGIPVQPEPEPSERATETDGEQGAAIPENALVDPDDPIGLVEGEIPADAFFSPDDPILQSDNGSDGIVTGMAGEPGKGPTSPRTLAWDIRRTANILGSLARSLENQGVEALRIHPETEPMDAMLRSFVAGYLVGRVELKD